MSKHIVVLAAVFGLAAGLMAADGPPAGSERLFNGKDLTGWKSNEDIAKHWTAKEGGVLDLSPEGKARGKDITLWSEKQYGDMTIALEWRWSGKPYKIKHPIVLPNGEHKKDEKGQEIQEEIDEAGDSGVYLRGSSKSQVNIWCWNTGSGEVYGYRMDKNMPAEVRAGVTPKKKMDKPYGEWNQMEITIKGDRLTVKMNGEEVVSNAQLPGIPAKGAIALQDHGNPIQFRNIYIKELK